jgi:hypothetical protein
MRAVKGTKPSPSRILELLGGDAPDEKIAEQIGESAAAVEEARELAASADVADAPAIAGLPVALAEAVLEFAVRGKRIELIRAVLHEGGREVGRAAKHALHKLRTQGVEVGEVEPAATEPVVKAASSAEVLPCYATPMDGAGQRAIWIARPQRFGGVSVLLAVISDTQGIVDVQAGEMSRKGFREYVRRASEITPGIGPREVSLARAKSLIAAALALSRSRGEIPDHADLLDEMGGDAAQAAPASASEPPLEPAEETRLASESGALHDEPEIAGWFPDEETLRTVSLKVEELGASRVVVDETQRKQQLQHVIDRARDDYFTDQRRQIYAGRLFEMADVFRASGREEAAKRAAATARALKAPDPATGSAFMRRLFEKLLPHLHAAVDEEKPKPDHSPGGLIVAP